MPPATAAKVAPKALAKPEPKAPGTLTALLAGNSPVERLLEPHGVFNSIATEHPVYPPVQDPTETDSSAEDRPHLPPKAPE